MKHNETSVHRRCFERTFQIVQWYAAVEVSIKNWAKNGDGRNEGGRCDRGRKGKKTPKQTNSSCWRTRDTNSFADRIAPPYSLFYSQPILNPVERYYFIADTEKYVYLNKTSSHERWICTILACGFKYSLRTGRQIKFTNSRVRIETTFLFGQKGTLSRNKDQNVKVFWYLLLRAVIKYRWTDIPRYYSRQDFLLREQRGLSSGTSQCNEMILPGLCWWVGSSSTYRFDLIRRNFDATSQTRFSICRMYFPFSF